MATLTKQIISDAAERAGFAIVGAEPGPGTRADIVLRDDLTDDTITVGIWPETTETEFLGMLSRAAGEVRGYGPTAAGPGAWLA
jgi:hypothetical protein